MVELAYKCCILAAILLCIAENIVTTPALAAALDFSGNMSVMQAFRHNAPVNNAINPDNQTLKLAHDQIISDIWPNLKISDNQIQLIFRPRIEAVLSESDHDQSAKVTSQVGEAFLQWTLSPTTIFAYGRQNYQWGPAELLSPSNHLFHESALDQGILYLPETKDLIRLNFSYRKNLSMVIMAEYDQNPDDPVYQAEEDFHPTIIIKPEISWGSSANYFGLVLGGREEMHPWTGQYFNLQIPFMEGLSLYGDVSQQKGSYAWYPTQIRTASATSITTMTSTEQDSKAIYNFWVGGLRYDFVGGSILRFEYVKNSAGYTKEQRQTMITALQSKNPSQLQFASTNLARFLSPGLELPGQEFGYVSWYYPDIFKLVDLKFFLRALHSFTDNSANVYSNLEYKIGDAGTLYGSVLTSRGKIDSGLYGQVSPSYMVAYKMSW